MAAMISASDVLHILSEIHQYSVILIELKDSTTVGISHLADGSLGYFCIKRTLTTEERTEVVNEVCIGKAPVAVDTLTMEQFLSAVEGRKPRHIWLETGEAERREFGFMSIAELKAHFRVYSKRQHHAT